MRAIDDRGPITIVTHNRLRALYEFRLSQRANWHGASVCVTHINLLNVIKLIAERRISLHVDLPGAAKSIEVVDIETPQRRLQGVENVADLNAEDLSLVTVDVQIDLRRIGVVSGKYPSELRLTIGRDRKAAKDRGQVSRRLPLESFVDKLEAASVAQPKYGRQVKRKCDRSLNCSKLRPQAGDDRPSTLSRICAFLIRL